MRIYKTPLFLLGALLLMTFSCYSQKILALNKPGKEKRIRYLVKDVIHIKLYGEKYMINGIITAVGDSSIDIEGFRIPIDQIRVVIDYDKRSWANVPAKVFLLAGTAFWALDISNRVTQNIEPAINPVSATIGVSLIGAGMVFNLLRVKRYRINKRHWLQVIDWGNGDK